ncbi:MAG: hypothetical protein OIF36_03335 [Alphaproteobacteria bacterium]|nr:hypothetical protein [Alphaproteobacteria bacterium]
MPINFLKFISNFKKKKKYVCNENEVKNVLKRIISVMPLTDTKEVNFKINGISINIKAEDIWQNVINNMQNREGSPSEFVYKQYRKQKVVERAKRMKRKKAISSWEGRLAAHNEKIKKGIQAKKNDNPPTGSLNVT